MDTSWENVAQWYDKIVGEKGQYYHKEVILPGLKRLLHNPTSVLDLGCGQGILARCLDKSVSYLGIDLSTSLITAAKKYVTDKNKSFFVHDLTKEISLKNHDFSHACCVLALQNIADPNALFQTAAKHLTNKGKLILVMNHPCFRIPRQSSWGIDEKKKCQYRRIDGYFSPMQIPIQARPGSDPTEKTISFHFPLSYYINALHKNGFVIVGMEEWISNKKSSGTKARMENRSREEFPLFLVIVGQKDSS
jgi:SAM-dependent methyltransferase